MQADETILEPGYLVTDRPLLYGPAMARATSTATSPSCPSGRGDRQVSPSESAVVPAGLWSGPVPPARPHGNADFCRLQGEILSRKVCAQASFPRNRGTWCRTNSAT